MKKYFLLLVFSFVLLLLAGCKDSDSDIVTPSVPDFPLALAQLETFEGTSIPQAFNFHEKLDTEFESISYYQPVDFYTVGDFLPQQLSEKFGQFDFSSLAYDYKYKEAYIIRCDLYTTNEDIYNVQYFLSKNPISIDDIENEFNSIFGNPSHHKNALVINVRNAFECAYPYINGKSEYMKDLNKVYVENLGEHTSMLPFPKTELKNPKDFSPTLYHLISGKFTIQRPRDIMFEKPDKKYGIAVTSFVSNIIEISYNGLFYSFQYWSENDDDENFHLQMRKMAKEFVLGSI